MPPEPPVVTDTPMVADPIGLSDGNGPAAIGPVGDSGAIGSRTARRAGLWIPTTALVTYLACRLATVGAVAIADLTTHNSVIFDLTRWDGEWFLRAVHSGYPSHLPMAHGHVLANPVAFFPMFPLLVRAGVALGIDAGVAALLLSAVTGLSAVWAVGLLARRLAGDSAASRAALLFAVFPGTFAFSFPYSEGIVITCVGFGLDY